MDELFAAQRAASRREPAPPLSQREADLKQLLALVRDHREEIATAISSDFGNRSHHESAMAEVLPTVLSIKHTLSNLKGWLKPSRRPVALPFKPGTARVHAQPFGVVGIIAPWNYPFQLAILPLAQALAAGNRVLIKPSELTPATSAFLETRLGERFAPERVAVVTGGPDVGAAFAALPFDHLFFTGSTKVGRLVMQAAAENLTPVTLELGGKSPAIVHSSYALERAADRIAAGKMFNAGQTCIAPDYALVPNGAVGAFTDAVHTIITRRYPTLKDNPDYTSIVSDGHRDRITGLMRDATDRGARLHEINPAGEDLSGGRKLAPTLLTGVDDDMAVMQEEIFGPVLPVVGYDTLDDALRYVNDHPRPLALYYFDDDKRRVDRVLEGTTAGGVTVNDTMLHFAQEELPFGGVGPSGMGAYHGHDGFRTFSHHKGVFHQARLNTARWMSPPYGDALDKLLNWVIG